MNAQSQPLTAEQFPLLDIAAPFEAPITLDSVSLRVSDRIEDVEVAWRQLTATSVESPGQSYDFIRLWAEDRKIPREAQRYIVAEVDGEPLALLPLHRKRVWGIRVFTWFPGAQAGCYAPVADMQRLHALGDAGRAALWRKMTGELKGADVAYLRSIPSEIDGFTGLFDQLGSSLQTETLYRVQFPSWEVCDREQRSRSRRKHDRQQGDRLAALGKVDFEEITEPAQARTAIETMFRQRSKRFKAQGIRDCFVEDDLIGFYQRAAEPGSGVDVRLHVLRLDGDIVAVRYNIVEGDRMFCLISSMSDDCSIQVGSPGKQCLLRVMQTIFDKGFSTFDMGAGFTDEKRHWCNVQIPLAHHYVPLSPIGYVVTGAHRNFHRVRAWVKRNKALKSALRSLATWRSGKTDKPVAASEEL